MQQLIECVPNFSEGNDQNKINNIVNKINSVDGITILDIDSGKDTNRTVVTFVGKPDSVIDAAFEGIKEASQLIDMSSHTGTHPRIGATDVCPLIPIKGISMDECVKYSHQLAERVGTQLKIPVYLYENSAKNPDRKNLAVIRDGEYEGLKKKLNDKQWKPDFGPAEFNAFSGATVIGCREFLIAYNINLNTKDKRLATDIAFEIREQGRSKRIKNPESSNLLDGEIVRNNDRSPVKVPGMFKDIKAIGWYVSEYNRAQISINFINYKVSSIHDVFDTVCKLAEERGVRVTGSELVGLIPMDAVLLAGKHYLTKQNRTMGVSEKDIIECAVQSLGLDDVSKFDPNEKIIENSIDDNDNGLMDLSGKDLMDLISDSSPAPGGGSVSAIAGSLGAALVSMVASLTHEKKDYIGSRKKMNEIGLAAQDLKARLIHLVEEDTQAFNSILVANRLPDKTSEQKEYKEKKVFQANKYAIEIPLETANLSLEVIKLSVDLIEYGNPNSVTDAEVASEVGLAGVRGGCMNVMINISGLENIDDYDPDIQHKIDSLNDEANVLYKKAFDNTKKIIS
ncbi:MAG: glutamate formimidoyltransferase [Candidatus Marinimicrobia bacterium]|nr:glutamate formimidoyltransferase [Candidatus Neomarinimicrobiota bacterium]